MTQASACLFKWFLLSTNTSSFFFFLLKAQVLQLFSLSTHTISWKYISGESKRVLCCNWILTWKSRSFPLILLSFFFFLKTMNSEFWLELILIFFAKEEHRSPFPYIATDVPFISSIWKYFWFLWTFPLALSKGRTFPGW